MEWINQFESISRTNPLFALFLAFIGGVLAGFTPCTYPLIPITVAFIGSKAQKNQWRGFVLSSVYVFGVAIVYASLGAFAALTGQLFGALTTSRWTYLFIGNICLLSALVMLDVISLKPPAFLTRMQVRQLPGQDILTCIIMGGASALVVSACTTPILGVLLAIVAARQNVIWGISLLFVFAYGLGFLVILVGTFTGFFASLPRSGMWMSRVQKFFAFLMILVGEYFLIKAGEFWI